MLTFLLDISISFLCQSGVASAHPRRQRGALSALFLECLGKCISLSLLQLLCFKQHLMPYNP